MSEGDGVGTDGEFSGVKNDVIGGGDDVEVNGDGAGESAGHEVGSELNVVTFWEGEFWKTWLPFELIHCEDWIPAKCNDVCAEK